MRTVMLRIVALVVMTFLAGALVVGCGSHEAARLAGAPRSSTTPAPTSPLPALNEELWVVVKPERGFVGVGATQNSLDLEARVDARLEARSGQIAQMPEDLVPGTGGIVTRLPGAGAEEHVVVPLKHTEVDTSVAGWIASVNVRQAFENPYDEKIEAIYVFPLPQNAAVNGFVMTIGERRIRGIVREREEAERAYAEAKRQGYVASLLTQERPNIFTQAVANIEPGKSIDVDITYFHTLAYDDGWYEYVFPMVVGPRFNPPGSTDGVGAVPRGAYDASGQSTEVEYIRPHERSGHDISLSVSIDAGVEIEEIACTSHDIELNQAGSAQAVVTLAAYDRIPNKDFVLRYRVAGDVVKAGLVTHEDERGTFAALMLYPPRELRDLERAPVELVFVVDCSGSMQGEPLSLAKRAMRRALKSMGPGDTFQVIRFSDNASKLGRQPVDATPKNVSRGLRHVDALCADGGTMMVRGIRAALDFQADPERQRYVVFLTDGYIGNERDVLGTIHDRRGDARIFSFGIGSAPNRFLLDRMARLGHGAVAYVGLNDDADAVMARYFERVSHPALTDVTVDWGGARVIESFPRDLPDLHVGRPVVAVARLGGDGSPASARLHGTVAGRRVETTLVPDADGATAAHGGIPAVWAHTQIADLMDQAMWDGNVELPDRVREVALEYGLVSAYTAFIAVDSSRRTEGDVGTTVVVPVPVPEGVKYETAVEGGPPRG